MRMYYGSIPADDMWEIRYALRELANKYQRRKLAGIAAMERYCTRLNLCGEV